MFKNKWLVLIIWGAMIVYVPAWGNFFSGDDWFHLRVSRVDSVGEWVNFFSFMPGDQAISFYRPLSTQLFFWLGQMLFGLQAWPWYVVMWLVFGYSLWLIYRVIRAIGLSREIALWAVFFYGFSVTNFTKLYFLSTFQELLMVVFVLLSIMFYLKASAQYDDEVGKSDKVGSTEGREFSVKRLYGGGSLVFFVLGLMAKETAIVLPGLLVLVEVFKGGVGRVRGVSKDISARGVYWLVMGIVTVGYLYLRLELFGFPEGDSFGWNFSISKTANTLMWYVFWALGAPEFLVDYVGSGLRVLPRFWKDFGWWGWVVIGGLWVIILLVLSITYKVLRITPPSSPLKRGRITLWFSGVWFVVSLLPVLFMPWHKFTLELTLPMVGVAMGLGWLVNNGLKQMRNGYKQMRWSGKKLNARLVTWFFIVSWLVYNLFINYLTYRTHYSVNRSDIARRVYDYMMENYPEYPEGRYFYFSNGGKESAWGVSAQISHAVGGTEMFKVIYNDNQIEVYFEDIDFEKLDSENNFVEINSNLFLDN